MQNREFQADFIFRMVKISLMVFLYFMKLSAFLIHPRAPSHFYPFLSGILISRNITS